MNVNFFAMYSTSFRHSFRLPRDVSCTERFTSFQSAFFLPVYFFAMRATILSSVLFVWLSSNPFIFSQYAPRFFHLFFSVGFTPHHFPGRRPVEEGSEEDRGGDRPRQNRRQGRVDGDLLHRLPKV